MIQDIFVFPLSCIALLLLIITFVFFSKLKRKIQSKRFQKEQQKKQDLKRIPEDPELEQMEISLNEFKKVKSPKVAGTNKEEEFNSLIQQAEYHHWQLTQAYKCGALLDKYYEYRADAKKSANRRMWIAYIGFFFAYLIALFCFTKFTSGTDADFIESIKMLGVFSIIALVISGIHLFVNFYIFDHIDTSGIKDLALTFCGFMLAYLILFIITAAVKPFKYASSAELASIIWCVILFSGIASALHIWINGSIFYCIKEKDEDTNKALKELENEIKCVSGTIDTHRPIQESVRIWKENVYYCIDELKNI